MVTRLGKNHSEHNDGLGIPNIIALVNMNTFSKLSLDHLPLIK